MIDFYLYDDTEDTQTRFVGFVGEHGRYDLAIIKSDRYFGKSLVLNTQSSKFGIIGPDDLDEVGYIAHILGLEDDEAGEVEDFLNEIIV